MSRRPCSYQYLVELREDYESKLSDEHWEWLHPFLKELLYSVQYDIHQIRENELCVQFQMEKNISIHFRDEELPLLEEFEKWRRDQYFTRSAFVKQCMYKALKENNPRRYAWTS